MSHAVLVVPRIDRRSRILSAKLCIDERKTAPKKHQSRALAGEILNQAPPINCPPAAVGDGPISGWEGVCP